MIKKYRLLLISLFLSFFCTLDIFANQVINLSDKEKKYLKNKKIIKMCVEPNWMPIEFIDRNGKHNGLGADYIDMVSKRIETPIMLYRTKTWQDTLIKAKKRKCDIISMARATEKRKKFLNFTKPYLSLPYVLITMNKEPNIDNLHNHLDKKFAVVKGYAVTEYLKLKYPQIKLLEVKSVSQGLKKLKNDEIFGFFGSVIAYEYHIKKNNIKGLKISKKTDYYTSLSIASRNDEPILNNILNKALHSISYKDRLSMQNKWFKLPKGYEDDISKLMFTNEQQKYLDTKKYISMCIHPNWYPLDALDKDGKHIGVASKYINIFSKSMQKEIRIVKTKNWIESLEFIKDRKCDSLSLVMQTPSRKKNMDFTTPYFISNLVVVGRTKELFIGNIEGLLNKKIGITKGYAYYELLKNRYPNIDIIEVNNLKEGLNLVENKKLDGYIDSLIVVGNYIQNEYYGVLKIISKLDEKWELSIGTRNDEPMLNKIFQKAIDNLPMEIHNDIKDDYLAITIEDDRDYMFILRILIIFILLVFFLLINQFILREKIKKAIKENNKKNQIIFRQAKLASLGEMISIIAHQWRQPLAQLGFINMYLKEVSPKDIQQEKIMETENILKFMSNTIDNFQSFYDSDEKREDFFISDAINEALLIHNSNLSYLGVSLKKEINNNLKLHGDKNNISQIILAMIQNSMDKFKQDNIENQEIIISLKKENKKIKLEVSDSAGGIKEEPIESIFDPFVTTSKSVKSSGIGLYMSKKIIEDKFGGKIKVSNTKIGAKFQIIF